MCIHVNMTLYLNSAEYQRLMEKRFGDLQPSVCLYGYGQPSVCLCCIDNLVIHAKIAEENLLWIEYVLECIHQAGLKLKPSKYRFYRRSSGFLTTLCLEVG